MSVIFVLQTLSLVYNTNNCHKPREIIKFHIYFDSRKDFFSELLQLNQYFVNSIGISDISSSAFEFEKWPLGLSSFTLKLFDVSFIIVYLFKMKHLQCHRKWMKLLIPITFKRCQLFSIWISIDFVMEM